MNDLEGKRVVIFGAARQGLALARFLHGNGAKVTVTDKQDASALQNEISLLADRGIHWVTGGHPSSLLEECDLVCVSGGIPLNIPILEEAHSRGIPFTNDSELFMQRCKAPVIGITGSAGKTTTTSLVGQMAKAALPSTRTVWVGGNIGNPLIEVVDQIQESDLVVLELSSFQLELMSICPTLAAILNITPNHLDRHGTMEAYTDAKSRILKNQRTDDFAVLNRDDAGSWALRDIVNGKLITFSQTEIDSDNRNVFIGHDHILLQDGTAKKELVPLEKVRLQGTHNLMNVSAACAIATALGFSSDAMMSAVESFTGVSHRLEIVRENKQVLWVNDSMATTPERTLAAIQSFNKPIILLLGGRDKNLPWDAISKTVHEKVEHAIIFGESGEKILNAIGKPKASDRLVTTQIFATLHEALVAAERIAKPGNVVLLSPGCTSYDAFKDFEERGEFFRKWVNQLP